MATEGFKSRGAGEVSLIVAAGCNLVPVVSTPLVSHVYVTRLAPKGNCLPGSDLVELVPGSAGELAVPNQQRRELSAAFHCCDSSTGQLEMTGCRVRPCCFGEDFPCRSRDADRLPWKTQMRSERLGICKRPATGSPAHHLSASFYW